jgi:Protein of unknown function (DUF4236)
MLRRMGWHLRFFRRLRLAPGLSLNLSKSGPSISVGPRGAKLTIGRGGVRRSIGIPGTGISATSQEPWTHHDAPDEVPDADRAPSGATDLPVRRSNAQARCGFCGGRIGADARCEMCGQVSVARDDG